jgi:hypothetical protein
MGEETMMYNLVPDKNIPKDRLDANALKEYGVRFEDDGDRSAILTCDDSKMLVRFDASGNVEKLVPLGGDYGICRILLALGNEFNATFFAGSEDVYDILHGGYE